MTLLAAALLDQLDDEALDRLAERLAPRLAERLGDRPENTTPAGYMTAAHAAGYLGVNRKRIYDLTSSRQLVPDGYDGRTPLYRRGTLDAYARGRSA